MHLIIIIIITTIGSMAEYILSSLRSTAGVIRCQMDEASGDDVNL